MLSVGHVYRVECRRKDGSLRWADHFNNLVVNEGLQDILDKIFVTGASYTAAHFVGLTDASPTIAAGDTMASHAGWVELTDYDEATRETYTLATASAGSANNSASPAVFNIDSTITIGGAFLTTDNTKGDTSGILVGVGAFAADRVAESGDIVTVETTVSMVSL